MLLQEGLLASEKDTVIVAAGQAWDEYTKLQVYVCQKGRPFQPVQYMGFYRANQILPLVPRILERRDRVRMERSCYEGELGRAVERLLDMALREPGVEYQVFVLSGPDHPLTVRLEEPIVNDLRSASDRPTAFTQSQRYVRLDNLRSAKRTSDLVTDLGTRPQL